MREIKFRAWDKKEKKMCPVEVLTYGSGAFLVGNSPTPDKDYHRQNMTVRGDDRGHFCKMKEIELMQYTGLKDKNGKEIYEGDVVRYSDDGGLLRRGVSVLGTIAWHSPEHGDPIWGWAVAVGEDDNLWLDGMWCIEVIGNIYENPELLKTK